MLRTVELVAGAGIPVLGINVVQLGYLTEVDPDGARLAIKRYLAGAYDRAERMLLATRIAAMEPSDNVGLIHTLLAQLPEGHTGRLAVSVHGASVPPCIG